MLHRPSTCTRDVRGRQQGVLGKGVLRGRGELSFCTATSISTSTAAASALAPLQLT